MTGHCRECGAPAKARELAKLEGVCINCKAEELRRGEAPIMDRGSWFFLIGFIIVVLGAVILVFVLPLPGWVKGIVAFAIYLLLRLELWSTR